MVMLKCECRTFVVLVSALAIGCGGEARTSSPDHGVDAGSSGGGAHDGGSNDFARGGSNAGGGGSHAGGAGTGGNVPDADSSVDDASSLRDARLSPDGSSSLCVPRPSDVASGDAGKCLGIYYARVAQLVLWVDDESTANGGARITLEDGESKSVSGHTYGYSGNSLITSGSRVEIHLDIDGHKDSFAFWLSGCAPQIDAHAWDYPATLGRTLCTGCTAMSIARHYSVLELSGDGGLFYTFTADEPPRTCGAGLDLLAFTTWPV